MSSVNKLPSSVCLTTSSKFRLFCPDNLLTNCADLDAADLNSGSLLRWVLRIIIVDMVACCHVDNFVRQN